MFEGFELDDDPERVDRDALWSFFSREAYWGRWRTRQVVDAQVDAAWRVVGAYEQDGGSTVGFARAISDGYGVAYLADVFVARQARGSGLGTAMIELMIEDGPGANFRWMLHTSDAHGFYERLGFRPADTTYLERPSPLATSGHGSPDR